MIHPTPSMFYITPPWFIRNEPVRSVYEQKNVCVTSYEGLVAGWPAQYLVVENLDLASWEIGQLFGGN